MDESVWPYQLKPNYNQGMIEVRITEPRRGFTLGKTYKVESFGYCTRIGMCLYIPNDDGNKYKNEARIFEVVSGQELYKKLILKAYATDEYVHCPR
jgi:hypothetical protein